MINLGHVLNRIVSDLANNVGPGLVDRAEKALDQSLDGDDLRTATIQFLVECARDRARYINAQKEKQATHPMPEPASRNKPVTTKKYYTASEWKRVSRAEKDQVAKETGHVGNYQPGSWSVYNSCTCELCSDSRDKSDEIDRKYRERLQKAFDNFERELKDQLWVEWTEEILSAEIAMPNGVRVTWGEATLDQHQERHNMLSKNAMANAENAARHSIAIDLLRKTGAETLNKAKQAQGAVAR